jgi:gliding motility-associated-like protein
MIRFLFLIMLLGLFPYGWSQQISPEAIQYFLSQEALIQPEIQGEDSLCVGTSAFFQAQQVGSEDSLVWSLSGPARIECTIDQSVNLYLEKPGTVVLTLNRYSVWGDGRDSLAITVLPAPDLGLASDTTICEGQSLSLQAQAGFPTYRWQDGSGEDKLLVEQAGTYWAMAWDEYGCKGQDIIRVKVAGKPQPDLGGDRYTCGEGYLLDPGSYADYRWQDGSTQPFFEVKKAGTYWVEVTNICSRKNRDTVVVKPWKSPKIKLGKNIFFCAGDTLELNAGEGFVDYRWQDGSREQVLPVFETGTYSVSATDSVGCEVKDTVYFEIEACVTELGLPEAFSPNGDGLNDMFKPLQLKKVRNMGIQVFTSSGKLVYFSNSPRASWDGKFANEQLPPGEYSYTIQYTLPDGQRKYDAGFVELRR